MRGKFIQVIICLLISLSAWSQAKYNNPLSHIGLGENILYRSHHLEMMGGLYGGYNSHRFVNPANPASLGFLRVTALDLAVSAGVSQLEDDLGASQTTTKGDLHHITLAFPMRNPISEVLERKQSDHYWSMGFDLRINSSVGYDISTQDSTEQFGNVLRTFNGSGGTYTFGWLNSYRYKDFSIGADIGVLFGNIESRREVVFLDILNPANDRFEDDINVNAFRWRLGAQYRFLLNPKEENDSRLRYLSIGVYGHSNSDLSTSSNSFYRGIRRVGSIQDTLVNSEDNESTGVYPGRLGFGVGIQPDQRTYVGFNIETQNWSDYSSEFLNVGTFENSFRVGIGGSIIPDPNAFGNYFKRVAYKAGVQYIQDGRVNNGESLNQIRVNAGMTMPFYYLRQTSAIHFGLEYARLNAGSLTDNYYGVTFGVTFNDNQWFLKRKFN